MEKVNKPIPKKDGMKLVTGAPVYTDDLAPGNALVIKILRSEHHFARIKNIDTSEAKQVPGVECVLTYKDVPDKRITRAGQTYPEASPVDWKILDEYVRYKGDEVAIIAAQNVKQAEEAMKLIKVEYEVLEPVLDYLSAKDNKNIIHPEKDSFTHFDMGFQPEKNIAATFHVEIGDFEKGLRESDVVITREYTTQGTHPAMMEPLCAYTYYDQFDRLTVVSSTQVPFHVRRMVAGSLDIPLSSVRIIKPRIGGGFGCKQTAGAEFFPAMVTKLTGKPAKIVFSRNEVFLASTRRHPYKFEVTVGATKEGKIKAFDVKAISDTGAYGEHSYTVMEACGEKCMAIYNKVDGYRFDGVAVYTNRVPSGAFRGYGKTQSTFAIESVLNELAIELKMDPTELRKKNIIQEGEILLIGHNHKYEDEVMRQDSCKLDYCLERGKELIGWAEKYPRQVISDTKVRGVGMGLAIHGSGIINIDSAGATLKLNSDGFFTLFLGSTDMGTGSDTILAQMAAEALEVPMEEIAVYSADTDLSPYDDGSYASSTTFVTGIAVVRAAEKMLAMLKEEVAALMNTSADKVTYSKGIFTSGEEEISLNDLGYKLDQKQMTATGSYHCVKEAPPYKAGYALVEVDTETGKVEVIDFVGVIDCGTPINTNLVTVQSQGGILQGIGMTLFEEVTQSSNGDEINDSFLTYKIPCKKDNTNIVVEFADSYEPSGPYGAKSIGEIVTNTAPPAIADAIYNAIGIQFRELPITPEKVFMALKNKGK